MQEQRCGQSWSILLQEYTGAFHLIRRSCKFVFNFSNLSEEGESYLFYGLMTYKERHIEPLFVRILTILVDT